MAETHGPEEAGYDVLGQDVYRKPCPWMSCICGFITRGNHTWEDVGREFDEHLGGGAANGE